MLAKRILMKSRYLLLFTILVFTACAPQVAATSIPAVPATQAVQEQPIALRLAVSDEQGRPSEPYVVEFVAQVKNLSNGNITIEPVWDAGSQTDVGFERGVVQLVKKGDFDLGLAGSRAFYGENINSFQALQAPFLIDNNALAEAVATSNIASKMLDQLPSSGLEGLTLWPEDLRHPFSTILDKPILSPGDIAGRNIRVNDTLSSILIDTLGGTPLMAVADGYEGAESGLRQGKSLNGTPTATGNVTFFSKYQLLFANDAAFSKLSDEQRSLLKEAALATQKKAIAEHQSEVQVGSAWCANGGNIVLASAEQVAAFESAAQPVYEQIAQDPRNAELIVAIRELKLKTEPSLGAEACVTKISQINTLAAPDNQDWSQGLPPNGKWTVNLTTEDVIAKGVQPTKAIEWGGEFFFEFQDGQGLFRGEYLNDFIAECPFTYEAVQDFFRSTYVDLGRPNYECGPEVDDLQWRLDEQGQLYLHVISIKGPPFLETKAVYEAKPWQEISGQKILENNGVVQKSTPIMVNIPGTHQDELGCSAEWLPDCKNTQLTYDGEDDVWEGTFEIQPANDGDKSGPRYKAAINGTWDENYGVNATQDGPDIPLVVTETTQVKFYYDPKTHWITDNLNMPIVVAMGDFQSEIGCTNDNDATCLQSWLEDPDGDGVYSVTNSGIIAGTYTVTFALNEDPKNVIGKPHQFTVAMDGDVVTFGYDSIKKEITINGTIELP